MLCDGRVDRAEDKWSIHVCNDPEVLCSNRRQCNKFRYYFQTNTRSSESSYIIMIGETKTIEIENNTYTKSNLVHGLLCFNCKELKYVREASTTIYEKCKIICQQFGEIKIIQ